MHSCKEAKKSYVRCVLHSTKFHNEHDKKKQNNDQHNHPFKGGAGPRVSGAMARGPDSNSHINSEWNWWWPARLKLHGWVGPRPATPMHPFIIGAAIGLSAGSRIVLLGLNATFIIRRWRIDIQKQLRRKYFWKNQGLLLEQLISSDENASDRTKIFSLEELEKATNNFDNTHILGYGGHGMVYKGILTHQRVVAIKKSRVIEQGEISQFINEVVILSQINHRNIVKLFGCCLEIGVPLLVYDFVPSGSLFGILRYSSISGFSLSWDDCKRIATEAAGASIISTLQLRY